MPVSTRAAQKDVLLKTKLYIPPLRPTLVPRPQLIERLNDGLRRKLTFISAPAGFGKTTLLSEWLHNDRLPAADRPLRSPVAWVSLDEHDNDLARFLTYVMAALETLGISKSNILDPLSSPQPSPMETVLTVLINQLTELPNDFVLVLDDYHVITAQPIHDALTFLLEHLPAQMHLVIASRAEPPLPLAHLRARNQLLELQAADLRFTPQEAATFLNQVMGLKLSADTVRALEARTEGWVAGLQLAALSMRGREDIPVFIQAFTGSHRYILDYLADQVLSRQPSQIQTFLLQTSILDRLTGSLCDALIWLKPDQPSSQGTLEALERANLFIVPLDEERRWYRYHHLFAEFLFNRLSQSQPDLIPQLHTRAAAWYEEQGLAAEAIPHALIGQDFERAARLVKQVSLSMLMRGEVVTLRRWLEALPDELVRYQPQLCLAHAWTLVITRQLDALEPRVREAERALGASLEGLTLTHPSETSVDIKLPGWNRDEAHAMLGEVAAIRATAARLKGDVLRTIVLSRHALDSLPEDNRPGVLHPPLTLKGVIALELGYAYELNGDVEAARRIYTQASAINQAVGNLHAMLIARCGLAQLQVLQGHLHQAHQLYQQALTLAKQIDLGSGESPLAGRAYLGMGLILYEWNDLEAAAQHILRGIEWGRQTGNVDSLLWGYLLLARLQQAQENGPGALETLRQAEALAEKFNLSRQSAQVAAVRARLWLAQGDLSAAARWAKQYQEYRLRLDDDDGYLREVEEMTLARVLLAQGQPDPASELLTQWLSAAQTAGRGGSLIEMLSLQALALDAQNDTAQAFEALERALTLAEPEGYLRLFVDQAEPMRRLLEDFRAHRQARSTGRAYVDKLLAAFPGSPPQSEIPHESEPAEPLSERELEILRLLTAGLSNREIAEQLVVGVGTINWHVNNIYRKLDVHSRTQAAARARALNLLDG